MRPYVSIDIETTGLDPENCQIIQFAAVLDDWQTPVDELPWFGGLVYHEKIVGEPYALAMNAALLKQIAEGDPADMLHPASLTQLFRNWLLQHGVSLKEKVLAAGKNFAGFDLQFLKRLPSPIQFKHRFFDPGMLFWNPIEDVDGPPDTKKCMERALLSGEVAHTALEDARVVCKLIRFAKQRRIDEIGRLTQTRNGSGPQGYPFIYDEDDAIEAAGRELFDPKRPVSFAEVCRQNRERETQ